MKGVGLKEHGTRSYADGPRVGCGMLLVAVGAPWRRAMMEMEKET